MKEAPQGQGRIPAHWNFKEKTASSPRRTIQIDEDQSYLAFEIIEPPFDYKLLDYIFDQNGWPTICRWSLKARGDDRESVDVLRPGEMHVLHTFINDRLVVSFSKAPNDWEQQHFPKWWRYYSRNSILYSRSGKLETLELESPFDSAESCITFTNEGESLAKREWQKSYIVTSSHAYKVMVQDTPNKLFFGSGERNQDFVLQWDLLEEEDHNGNKALLFVVNQTNLSDQTRKILKCPLNIDLETIRKFAWSKPPYQKDEKGRLVVPWANIDRLVGASLSYSYPPEKTDRKTEL